MERKDNVLKSALIVVTHSYCDRNLVVDDRNFLIRPLISCGVKMLPEKFSPTNGGSEFISEVESWMKGNCVNRPSSHIIFLWLSLTDIVCDAPRKQFETILPVVQSLAKCRRHLSQFHDTLPTQHAQEVRV